MSVREFEADFAIFIRQQLSGYKCITRIKSSRQLHLNPLMYICIFAVKYGKIKYVISVLERVDLRA